MNCCTRFTLAAVVSLIFIGCRDNAVTPPSGGPEFAVLDGAHNDGNPDFFFLPPMFKNPNTNPKYEPTAFNANVKPAVVICELDLTIGDCRTDVTQPFKTFGPSDVALNATEQLYSVNWNTTSPALSVDKFYRIQVFVSGQRLGFADVDPVINLGSKQLQNAQTGEYIPLVDGKTLPIKFRIESGALCPPGTPDNAPCNSKTINLNTGGTVELLGDNEDFKFDVRPGTSATFRGQTITDVTFNLEVCTGLDFDLPTFGSCLQVSTFFNGPDGTDELTFSQPLLISMCVLNSAYHTPDETRQEDLITLHQQDGSLIVALPHAIPNCGGTIGTQQSGWGWLRQLAAQLLPKPAYAESRSARNAVLHVGAGGETSSTGTKCTPPPNPSSIVPGMYLTTTCPPSSPTVPGAVGPQRGALAVVNTAHTVTKFQFALPAMMDYIVPSDADRTAAPGTVLPTGVHITDWDGANVQGAHITFYDAHDIIIGTATSGTNGQASIQWTIHAGDNFAFARGRGIAGPNNYPRGVPVRPFMPDIDATTPQQPVALGAFGELPFHATGGQPDLVISNVVVGPVGLTFADNVTYDVTVTNQGDGPAGPFNVFLQGPPRLGGGDVGADNIRVTSLAAHTSTTVRSTLGPRAPGSATVRVNADQNNEVAESDELNNAGGTEFGVEPRISFETLGNGTPISTIGLPLALVNDYSPQGLAFSYVQANGDAGVASLCNSQRFDPVGVLTNHAATIQASGDPCTGFTLGEVTITFDAAMGLPTTVQVQLHGPNGLNPFPLVGFDAAGNALGATRLSTATYDANNGVLARRDVMEIQSSIGIAGVSMNLPAGTQVVFMDDMIIIR